MPRRHRIALTISTAAVVAVMLSACSTAPAAPAADAAPVAGGTIVYAHQQEPACVFGGWIEQEYLSSQVLDGLVSLDSDHQVVPWLAESWSTSADQLTWTFTLKDGVSFTDGSPLTAGVVAYNFDYWVGGGNSTAKVWLETYYASANAVDDRTLEVHLARPYPQLADNLTQGYFGIQSQEALSTRTKEQNCEAPIGSGAFVVEQWNRGTNIVLTRNAAYTSPPANAKHTGAAYVDRIDWQFVADGTTRAASLSSGQVNAIYDVPANQWESLQGQGFQELKYVTAGRPQQLSFNTANGPFVDESVRKAFAYSLDRRSIVETIGQGVIPYEGNGAVSQTTPGYSQAAADTYSLDLDRANALLDAAGWTGRDAAGYRQRDGASLEVLLPYGAGSIINADGAAILQGVQQQAKATGFKVDLVPVPQAAFFGGAYAKPTERDLAVGYWTAVGAGITYINWRQDLPSTPNYNNAAFYNDPVLDDLIVQANGTADVTQRSALYGQVQQYIADHALSIGLYDRLSTLAVSPYLKDVWQENAQGGPVFYDAYFVQ